MSVSMRATEKECVVCVYVCVGGGGGGGGGFEGKTCKLHSIGNTAFYDETSHQYIVGCMCEGTCGELHRESQVLVPQGTADIRSYHTPVQGRDA